MIVSGARLLIGGAFEGAGGVVRENLAALDIRTGRATSWDPGAGANRPSNVLAIDSSSSSVVIGGEFTRAGGRARNGLAVLDAATGKATWKPPRNAYAFAVQDNTLYFNVAPDRGSERIAAFDVATGRPKNWTAVVPGVVQTLVTSPTTVFAAISNGENDRDLRRYGIVAVDVKTRKVEQWPAVVEDTSSGAGDLSALALAGHRLYAGGIFNRVGGLRREGLAAFDTRSERLTPWRTLAFAPGGYVEALYATSSAVYVGGFDELLALHPATGRRLTWQPSTTTASGEPYVDSIVGNRTTIFVGGEDGVHADSPAGSRP
jgi:hypothetical protein